MRLVQNIMEWVKVLRRCSKLASIVDDSLIDDLMVMFMIALRCSVLKILIEVLDMYVIFNMPHKNELLNM